MSDGLLSAGLLGLTVVVLIATRARGLLTQMTAEAGLLLAIGTLLVRHGTSPLPYFGSVRVGLADAWFRVLAVIWWLVGARLVVNITDVVRGRDPKSREARLFSDLAAAVIYITTVLIVLNSILNLNVKGLLVTSGVIAIVLGLALQNTLADVFSGIAVGLEKPFRVGDRVSLGDDVEGVIVQMNWRSFHVQTDGDDLAIIPNSVVAKGTIVNRSVPTRHRAASVEIVVPPDVHSGTVFELMRQATLLCPGLLSVPAPSATILRSGLHSSTYATSFFVSDSPGVGAAKSTLLRQMRRLLQHAGIGRQAPLSLVELLGSLVLFEALSQPELEALSKELIVHVVEPGDTIFGQGCLATSIFVIEAGVMESTRRNSHALDEPYGRIGPGEYIGELGLITHSPRACTLKALTQGRVLELPGDSLARLLKSNAALNVAMERSVRRGLASLDRDEAARAEHPTEQAMDTLARIKAFFRI